jgi:hypothetical protein
MEFHLLKYTTTRIIISGVSWLPLVGLSVWKGPRIDYTLGDMRQFRFLIRVVIIQVCLPCENSLNAYSFLYVCSISIETLKRKI